MTAVTDWIHPAELDALTKNPGLRPELTESPAALPSDYRDKLIDFIHALLDQRGFPQHLAVIFNALRYGYDPDASGYHRPLLDDGLFTDVWAAETCDAVPVGAFVHVLTDREIGSIPAEVVYKEGRHPDVTSTHVPDDLPGRFAAVEDGEVSVREALVLDRCAFVRDDLDHAAALERAVQRIRDAGRELDARGHYVGALRYRSLDDAQRTDVDFFIRWLADREQDRLLAELLNTDDPGTARTALQQIFRTLRAVIAQGRDTPGSDGRQRGGHGLALWRGYVYDRQRYRNRVSDDCADSVYGASALRRLWRSISEPPVVGVGAGAPDRVALHPLSARLLDLADPTDAGVAAHIDETAWLATVVHAQVFLADRAEEDRTDDGLVSSVLKRDGVGVHTRVDDPWQHGSIWRTERFALPLRQPPPTLLRHPPGDPLGLGAQPWEDDDELPAAGIGAPEAPAADEAAPDAAPADEEDFLRESYLRWTVRLAPTRLAGGQLPVPTAVCAQWRPGRSMTVRLDHLGTRDAHTVTFDAQRRLLVGLDWPANLNLAAEIRCQVATDVGTLVTAETTPLDPPRTLEIDGTSVQLRVKVDEALLRRALSETAPSTGEAGATGIGSGRGGAGAPPGIVDALVRLLEVSGEQTSAGGKRMDMETLTRRVFPTSEPTPRLRSLVLRACQQVGLSISGGQVERFGGADVSADADVDLAQLADAGDERAQLVRAARRPHPVRMHLRRLSVSERASPQRQREYPSVRSDARAWHLPERLPPGYTYVADYETGTASSA